MDASGIEALKSAFLTNTNWAEWAATFVFIGLLGDIAVIIIFDWFDPHVSRWQFTLAAAATVVIAIGVWGESHFGHRATTASGQLQAALEKQAADANERAAKAEAATETEKQERLAFEKLYGPRRFTDDQRGELIKEWDRYAGKTVKLRALWDPETDSFADDLEDILKSAGVIVKRDPTPPTDIRGSGVIVRGPWTEYSAMTDFARSLDCTGMWSFALPSCSGGLPTCPGFSPPVAGTPLTCDIEFIVLPKLFGREGKTTDTLTKDFCRSPIPAAPSCAP